VHSTPPRPSNPAGHNVYLEFASGASGSPPYVSLHYFDFPTS
jgi:hypothetical protein